MEQSILEWILTLTASGGIGAAITYIFTFKSKKKQVEAEAESSVIDVELKKTDLKQDQCDYLLKTCDKYIKDYHELEDAFRKRLQELRQLIDTITLQNAQAISTKCTEIAALRSKVTYLQGIRCYNFTCLHRIKTNPDKSEE